MHRYPYLAPASALVLALVAVPSNAMLLFWFFVAVPFAVTAEKQSCEALHQQLTEAGADENTLLEHVFSCMEEDD